MQDEVIGG